jgi:exonuclease VII large subunit
MKYKDALSCPECKASYKKTDVVEGGMLPAVRRLLGFADAPIAPIAPDPEIPKRRKGRSMRVNVDENSFRDQQREMINQMDDFEIQLEREHNENRERQRRAVEKLDRDAEDAKQYWAKHTKKAKRLRKIEKTLELKEKQDVADEKKSNVDSKEVNWSGGADDWSEGKGLKSGVKKTSPWIEHVRSYANAKGIRYFDALKDPNCKSSYKNGSGIPTIRPQSAERPVLNMTRYGKAGTFTREDVARIDKEDKERSAMKKAMVNSVTY